ncbi:MAG: sugar ABC transporter permease [Actinobacteria bacterium]|nr:sugar ABC transporter permease [Actinomycetota bacterium]
MNRRLSSHVTPYLLILPAVLLTLLFVYGVANGILQGFGIIPYLGLTTPTLDYYRAAFTRSDLSLSILYTFYLALSSSVLATLGGVALSAAITRVNMGRKGQLMGIQIPLMTSHAIVALFIISLFSGSGLVARLLYAGGLIDSMQSFPTVLGATSGWGIILVYLWKEIPFVAFCTVTLMSHMGDRYAEAAACLGASPLRTFFSVTLPLCKRTIAKAFLIVFAFAFGAYEVPFLLGATLPKALPVLAYVEFQKPDLANHAYAMALCGIMAGICIIVAIVYFQIMRRERKRPL